MPNELILVCSLVVCYLAVLLLYRYLGRTGLYLWTAIATITANIEVLMTVDAFGMEMTLGNILFASTFLVTDIMSETQGRKYASRAVQIGILSNLFFIIISQSWFLYQPNATDWVSDSIYVVFSNTPRLMLVALVVYGIAQLFDVWFYHYIWKRTEKFFGDTRKGLWMRNNGSTLVSQFLNSILFTIGAFAGMYSWETLTAIIVSSYVIFLVTSLADTPIVYLARRMKPREIDC